MEYVEGRDLRRLQNAIAGGRLSEYVVLYIFHSILNALDYAHNKSGQGGIPLNIVHRDVSPQNIIVTVDGMVKLTDFGIAVARERSQTTRSGILKGKLRYMSPEQVQGKEITPKSDIFSLGILIFELLSGRRFFDGETDLEIIDRIRSYKGLQDDELNAMRASDELIEILRKMLHPDPLMRQATCKEIINEMDTKGMQGRINKGAKDLQVIMERYFGDELRRIKISDEEIDSSENFQRCKEDIKRLFFESVDTKTVIIKRSGLRKIFFLLSFVLPAILIYIVLNRDKFYDIRKEAHSIVEQPQKIDVIKDKPVEIEEKENNQDIQEKREQEDNLNKKQLVKKRVNTGFVSINSFPWGNVIIDGKDTGKSTPLLNLELSEGKHTIEVYNPGLNLKIKKDIYVKAGERENHFIRITP